MGRKGLARKVQVHTEDLNAVPVEKVIKESQDLIVLADFVQKANPLVVKVIKVEADLATVEAMALVDQPEKVTIVVAKVTLILERQDTVGVNREE